MYRQRGVTLIELTLALAIIAAILLGATRVYRIVDNSYKVTSAANMILSVYQAAGQWADDLPTNTDLIIPFKDRGYLLEDFMSETANPWGGEIKATAPSARTLEVVLTDVPSELCNNLADKFKSMQNAETINCLVSNQPQDFYVTFNMDFNKAPAAQSQKLAPKQ